MTGLRRLRAIARAALVYLAVPLVGGADPLPRGEIEPYIVPPYALGEAMNDRGVWELLNSGGAQAGYVLETEPLAPLPGFSGAPINMLVTLDPEGRIIDVQLLSHNEPIFVSGLGEAPFHAFFEQYPGHAISDSMVVGTPYGQGGEGSGLVYLDGVTKATASVRIAHESLIAAAREVARDKMKGVSAEPPPYPDLSHDEPLSWDDLVAEGHVARLTVSNAEVDAAFASTIWSHDDPAALADPEGLFLDLWVVDLGPPSLALAVLSEDTLEELDRFRVLSPDEEPILVVETARHGLVSDAFVRNTAPDRLSAEQDGLPVALRDADLYVELADDLPWQLQDGVAMILRTDRRLGFDPTREWTLHAKAVREHGMFQPEIGSVDLSLTHATDARFYARPEVIQPLAPWREAILNRQGDIAALAVGLAALVAALAFGQSALARLKRFTALRLAVLAGVVGFVGWWGQGQLSIVTPLAVLAASVEGASLSFLLYDPFSLLIWAVALLGLVLWGRGLFCGWLCPFGAMQELAHHVGRRLGVRQIAVPVRWDGRLKFLKYGLLAGLVATALIAPQHVDKAAEIEPFKTAITVFFVREWYYVLYAVLWLVLGAFLFKGFCRYVCPLGALMALGGALRGRDWIARREACGSPCQLCAARCRYKAIERSGKVDYSECFQCLDCVTIHEDSSQCVPLILAARQRGRVLEAAE